MTLAFLSLEGPMGARVHGLDLSRPIPPQQIDQLRFAWARYRVLLIRDQPIDDLAHARLAMAIGEPLFFGGGAQLTDVIYGSGNIDEQGKLLPANDERLRLLKMNSHWHADGSYRKRPNRGVILRALDVPEVGGETEFADLALSYAALPSSLRNQVKGRTCLHSFARMISQCDLPPVGVGEALPSARHPLVWRLADGTDSLFLSPPYMCQIDGCTDEESAQLVQELTAVATTASHVLRHSWRVHDILLWDNRSTIHRVCSYDMSRHRRVMRGATLAGAEEVTS